MDIEFKRIELEYNKVKCARMDLEFKILERQEEIERIQTAIEIQIKRENELLEKMGESK